MATGNETERHREWSEEYLKEICGYANAQGGKIYIGCDDICHVVGVQNAHKLLEDIPNKVRDNLGISVEVRLLEENGKEYIEIDVPSYPVCISCKGDYYFLSGSTRQILTGPALEAFLMRKRGATWDNMPLPTFSLEDVDDGAVARFKQLATKTGRFDSSVLDAPKDVLMDKLHLTNGQYLTNAAMLLFSKDPERWQLGVYIKIGYFENDADLLFHDEVHGSLLEQLDKTVDLIYSKYMRAKITYERMQRIERYFVPEAALREALLNAICHKSYQSGIPIQISVYEDKLYIANCACLPENLSANDLMQKHDLVPYNPNIAHVLYLAGFIESWGQGIEKICSACRKDGVPLPEYESHPNDIMVKFVAPEDRIVSLTKRVVVQVTDKDHELLTLIKAKPTYTLAQLAERLRISRQAVATALTKMRKEGLIKRIGNSHNGYWQLASDVVL